MADANANYTDKDFVLSGFLEIELFDSDRR
jgi:hypothetical protein